MLALLLKRKCCSCCCSDAAALRSLLVYAELPCGLICCRKAQVACCCGSAEMLRSQVAEVLPNDVDEGIVDEDAPEVANVGDAEEQMLRMVLAAQMLQMLESGG